MTTWSLPLRVIEKNDGTSLGDVSASQTFTVAFNETGVATAKIRLPKPYRIVNLHIDTLTAFDAATATLALGVTGETTRFATALNVKAAGRVLASSDATKLAGMRDTSGSSGSVDLIATLTAAGGTAGSAEVTVEYVCPRPVSD